MRGASGGGAGTPGESDSVSANRRNPVLLIGLDAAEIGLIERGIADGTLTNLARLRARGAFGRLRSTADWLVGTPWPSFYTSSWPADHGFVNYLQWRSGSMTHSRPDDSWLPITPFWRQVASERLRTITVDVPVVYPPPSFGGIELAGWSSHDQLWPPAAHPPGLLRAVSREFGQSPMDPEVSGLQTRAELMRQGDRLVRATGRTADLALAFMERYPWDLFLVGFGATHRAGHKLWDDTSVSGPRSPGLAADFASALQAVYQACDAAVGRLVAAAPSGAAVLVFALHGMGFNHSRVVLLPEMLERILAGGTGAVERRPSPGLAGRLRRTIPVKWRSALKHRLPQKLQDRLALFWHRELRSDWSRTRALPCLGDLEGYVQVNRKGRERDGIVEPAEGDALLEEIAAGLGTFVDEDTGEPVVHSVGRASELYPPGKNHHCIPDLTVRWMETPAHRHRALVSPRYGRIPWPTPGKNPDGRSGHHRSTGWLIATAPGVGAGGNLADASILDLAPTALALLEEPVPDGMRGKPIGAVDR